MTGGNVLAPRDGEEVQVTCWCEEAIVWVRIEDIRAGITDTCGRDGCEPKENA